MRFRQLYHRFVMSVLIGLGGSLLLEQVQAQEVRYQDQTFAEWQHDLQDLSLEFRMRAVTALGQFGAQAVPALVQVLRDPEPGLRLNAAATLGQIGPAAKDAAPALVELLRDRGTADAPLPMIISHILVSIGSTVIPLLVQALRDPDAVVRFQAARTLGAFGPAAKEAVPALVEALQDSDKEVPMIATRALGEIGMPAKDAVPALRKLGERDPKLKDAVKEALSKIEGR